MPKGGARTRSGPPPDPNSLRSGEWTTLPAEGRQGPAPAWPLVGQSEREAEMWENLWRLPQALEWDRLHQEPLVALYVRRFIEAEAPGSAVNLSTLVRQLADELALTRGGLLRARLLIGSAADEQAQSAAPERSSARSRLQMVPGGAA